MSDTENTGIDKLPETDDEVRAKLLAMHPGTAGHSLHGIYRCERAQGKDLLDAYRAALMTVVTNDFQEPLNAGEAKRVFGKLYAIIGYGEFCRILEMREDEYSMSLFKSMHSIAVGLGAFDPVTLQRLIDAVI